MGQVKFRIEGGIKSEGNLLPDDNNNEYYIGASDLKWKGIYLGTDGVVFNDGSTQTTAAGTPSGATLLSTTTLNGASTTISNISTSYKTLYAVIYGVTNENYSGTFRVAPNGTTNITDTTAQSAYSPVTWYVNQSSYLYLCAEVSGKRPVNNNSTNTWALTINNYADTNTNKSYSVFGGFNDADNGYRPYMAYGHIRTTSAITSLVFSNNAGAFNSGTVLLYGVN